MKSVSVNPYNRRHTCHPRELKDMMKKSGLIIVGVILLAGLTAAVALGATYAPGNAGSNYAAPQGATANQPWGWGGMMGRGMGRGMMGYRYSTPAQNATLGCGGWSRCAEAANPICPYPQGQQANTVAIAGYGFAPQVITVKAGTTVTWTNYDAAPHSVDPGTPSAPTGLWNSGDLTQGQSFSYTFTTAGVYAYYCDEHSGMTGVVIVEA